ncbi:WbqC family protein [Roseateles oligotrophus]|uniref:WbqC family protein n=1 Tax=Roseateles oligotrophus TaxID=1769250 RepID=A0ABT2YIJ5_9BURK|nr:WbqC family protein [Roseateles oligotrophus]MCV2369884.1 WbqC family protein [Roseateles oligotrophus]
MKYSIMQPYFFPYLGYYSLIRKSDRFILFDDVQFIRHGWIERNRILKPVEGWQYISVPLEKVSLGTKIDQVRIKSADDWRDRILRQLEHYKKKSPFYAETIEVVKKSIGLDTSSIVELNRNILFETCKYIGIQIHIDVFSTMQLQIEPVNHPGEWALNITKCLAGTEYINPVGGVDIFKQEQFDAAGISISFMGNNLTPYSQRRGLFEPGLSIIDAMMFNEPEQIRALIDDTYLL